MTLVRPSSPSKSKLAWNPLLLLSHSALAQPAHFQPSPHLAVTLAVTVFASAPLGRVSFVMFHSFASLTCNIFTGPSFQSVPPPCWWKDACFYCHSLRPSPPHLPLSRPHLHCWTFCPLVIPSLIPLDILCTPSATLCFSCHPFSLTLLWHSSCHPCHPH